MEGDGPWVADAHGRGTGEVDSEATSILWLTASCGDDELGLRGQRWRPGRRLFDFDSRKALNRIGSRNTRSGMQRSGSAQARSGGAVRSTRRKLVPDLRLTRAEPASPSYRKPACRWLDPVPGHHFQLDDLHAVPILAAHYPARFSPEIGCPSDFRKVGQSRPPQWAWMPRGGEAPAHVEL